MKAAGTILVLIGALATPAVSDVSFSTQIRPILSDRCFACHGPDSATRKADLRLDTPDGIRGVVVPEDAAASALIQRLMTHDLDDRMPPQSTDKTVTPGEIAAIRQWIEEGAVWESHWSFVSPTSSRVPAVPGLQLVNPIDAFVQERLAQEGLATSEPADRATYVRRVTLDLTGLPPSEREVSRFLADDRPGAKGRLVDRLLGDSRYGEHQARFWLDAARYGDTHGLHLDNERVMWKYRDWVVDAFNRNLPYDQFVIEQLAGDLLENPTLDQHVASGFNRCHVTTNEGGAYAEEYLVKYAMDRINTVGTVFMGMTVECAACHEHKFDPISQREYYQMLAYFNNTAEKVLDGNIKAPPPVIRVPDKEQAAMIQQLTKAMESATAAAENPPAEAAEQGNKVLAQWEQELGSRWESAAVTAMTSEHGATLWQLEDGSILVSGATTATDTQQIDVLVNGGLTAVRLDAIADERLPGGGPGRNVDNGNFVLTELTLQRQSSDGTWLDLLLASAEADYSQKDYPVAAVIDGDRSDSNGWANLGGDSPTSRTMVVRLSEPLGSGTHHIRLTLEFLSRYQSHDFGRVAIFTTTAAEESVISGGTWEMNGPIAAATAEEAAAQTPDDLSDEWIPQPTFTDRNVHTFPSQAIGSTFLRRTITLPGDRIYTIKLGSDDGVRVWVDGEKIHDKVVNRGAARAQDLIAHALTSGKHEVLLQIINTGGATGFAWEMDPPMIDGLGAENALAVLRPPALRSPDRQEQLATAAQFASWPQGPAVMLARDDSKKALTDYTAMIPTTLVSAERSMRRQTHVLRRGEYDQPLEAVDPGTPAFLPPATQGEPTDRLGFAKWLVQDDHPLTSRVYVNRIWQQHFGIGLVETAGDFGSQGDRPTHPELLDWLSRWFIDSGWDIKALHRQIVTSETYQQKARVTKTQLAVDPMNRWLGRAPRFRLDAEVIRDQALLLGGLLVEQVGGPPVKPYQPSGLWEPVAYSGSNTRTYVEGSGRDLHRRSLYTFWKRTSPPPGMTLLDAPQRESCSVRRERTNTPMAALLVLNDVQFVEAARGLATRTIQEGGHGDEDRIRWAFSLVTGHLPTDDQVAVLQELLQEHRVAFEEAPEQATALMSVGEMEPIEHVSLPEQAAWTMVANLLLNLDEVLTRG